MQVPYSICIKIQKTGNIQGDQSRYRTNFWEFVKKEGNRDHRSKSRSISGSYPYAGKNITEIFSIRDNGGVSEGEKFVADIQEAYEPEI